MRTILPWPIRDARVLAGPRGSDPSYGVYGQFELQGPCGERLCIVSSGADADDPLADGWEHVSVSTRRRTPNWREMCFVKDMFWDEEEVVVQFHPRRSEYVNDHPYCLHMWKRKDGFPTPPPTLVGVLK